MSFRPTIADVVREAGVSRQTVPALVDEIISLSLCFEGVEITRGRPGADAACIGACGLVINRYVAEVEPAMRASLY